MFFLKSQGVFYIYMKEMNYEKLELTSSEEKSLIYAFDFVRDLFKQLDIEYFTAFGTLIGGDTPRQEDALG